MMNLDDKIETIMSSDLTTVKEDKLVSELKPLFDRRNIHHVLVESKSGEVKGIISTKDFYNCALFPVREKQLMARHIMTTSPVVLNKNAAIIEAISYLMDNRFRAVPIIDDNKLLVGIITPYDIMCLVLADYERQIPRTEDFGHVL